MSTPGIGSASNNNPLTNLFNGLVSNPGNQREDYFYPMAGINPFSPPDMKTLVYAPEVRILIARGHKQYDVSRDLVRGTIHRRENSASSLFFTLANSGDYNGLFQRMDRVVVFLKRIRWQQVFSGYLDTVPYAQLYGGPAEYKATCTIKRLMHTWWSPDLPASMSIMNQYLFAQGGDRDSGLGQLMRELMVRVGGWQPEDVHVQNFPMAFYEFLKSNVNVNRAANQAQADKFKQLLLGANYNQVAPGAYAGWSNNAGPAGPPGQGEAFYIAQIVAACDSLGLGPVVQDLTNSQQIAQAAATGAEAQDNKVKAAFTQAGQTAANWNQASTDSDAAILGVACAMAETGGGVTIRNLANQGVPDSLRFMSDGLGSDHDSIGIFQQRGNGAWGSVSQRMDPRQAATMFFQALPPDWRNMDPGQAIHMTQRNATGSAPYSAAYPLAKEKVAAYRAAMKGAQTTMASTPLGSAASAIGNAVGVNPVQVATTATTTPATPGSLNSLRGKPNPDSEGAVQTALLAMSAPYHWGGKGPNSYDCSGLMTWAYRGIGKNIGDGTSGIAAAVPRIDPSQVGRGDLIITNGGGHVVMYYEPGFCIETGGPEGTPGGIHPLPPPTEWVSVHRVCQNGGPDPAAPRMSPLTAGPGTPAGTGDQYTSGTGGGQADEPIARNLFAFAFTPDRFASDVAGLFTADHKEFIDSEPLIQMVQAVARAGLRNFASAPDGSFMAYYPDYFGLDGKKAVVQLEDIELKNVKIDYSDDNLTTHVYVAGDHNLLGADPTIADWLETAGSVTVEHEWLYRRLTQIAPGDLSGADATEIMRRFGVRPLKMPIAMAGKRELEFLLACQVFMEKWAEQYRTTVDFTFLPELFPGMRVILSGHDLQVYVSSVTHSFDFESGFHTQAEIMAPSKPDAANLMVAQGGTFGADDTNVLTGLGFNADGTTSTQVMPGF